MKIAPTACLCLCFISIALGWAVSPQDGTHSSASEAIANLILPFIIAWWVLADARRRQKPLCYDYESFMFFAWPVLLPIYLIQTRRGRALVSFLWIAGLAFVSGGLAYLMHWAFTR